MFQFLLILAFCVLLYIVSGIIIRFIKRLVMVRRIKKNINSLIDQQGSDHL